MRKILLNDTSNLARRNYHAQNLSTTTGIQTGLVYGTVNSIISLQKDHQFDKIINVWDSEGGSAFRKALWPLYKGNRSKDPEYVEQKQLLEQLLTALGAYQVSKPGVEADDIVGYLANVTYADDMIYILSTDKDYYQLISERVVVVHPLNGPVIPNAEGKVPIKDGQKTIWLHPKQVIDYKVLKGDTSDNLSGAPGFGIGAAITFFENNNSVQQILDNTVSYFGIKPKPLEGLRTIIPFIETFTKLVTINMEEGAVPEPTRAPAKPELVRNLFEMLEFNEFMKMNDEVFQLIGGTDV